MTSQWTPYLLVRPGGLPFIDEIRADLHATALTIDAESVLVDWRSVSRRLYFDQYGEPGTRWLLQEGAEAWLETTVALFGNRGLLMLFGAAESHERRLALASLLASYKQEFRGRRRRQRQRIAVTCAGATQQWPVYFDGIHVPEPDADRIAWELEVIEQHPSDPASASAVSLSIEV